MRRKLHALLIILLSFGVTDVLAQGSLSEQVLRLLTRTNTWVQANDQTFQNNVIISGADPSNTTNRLYEIGNNLFYNGVQITVGGGPAGAHNLLSSTHSDTVAATVVRGDIAVGNATPAWNRLALGAVGTFLRSNGTDLVYGVDGSALTALNATQLTSGTVPLARLVGITNTEIDAAAAIAWTKISKTGSSLADLTTRSAADLSSGTLADARLSSNVSLFGASVDNAEITAATILFDRWAANGCAANQGVNRNAGNTAWQCTAIVTAETGTVSSVGLSLPAAVFDVTGSPVTTSGTLTAAFDNQTANLVFAGPSSGVPAAPTFRSLVTADFPLTGVAAGTYTKVTVDTSGRVTVGATISYATDGTGTLPMARGGTDVAAAADDRTLVSSGTAWVVQALSNCPNGLAYATATNTFSCAATPPTHTILSTSHSDTLAGTVVRGDLIIGNSTPAWTRLAVGAVGQFVRTDGTDVAWTTYADKIWLDAGRCQNVTTVLDWSTPTTNPGVAACVTGTNTQKLVVDFADGASELSVQRELRLPATFTGAIDADFTWYTSATAGDVVWRIQTICVADGETGDPVFNTASTVTDTAKAVANQYNVATITGVTITGCAASEVLYVRVARDPTVAGDTLAATARLVGLELTVRRQI